ncbi:MAG: hypothetical protein O2U61_02560 [Candidatus Bathyarchaeota archaeon]|nr:hypothetical protein [Candidatus Bathyarchaeota archaeon]
MAFEKILNQIIDKVNERAKSDETLKNILRKYDEKRVIINIKDDTIYATKISVEEILLEKSMISNPEDMYVELDKKTAQKLICRNIDFMQIMTMVLTGKIKIRNIGIEEIDLIKRIIGKDI